MAVFFKGSKQVPKETAWVSARARMPCKTALKILNGNVPCHKDDGRRLEPTRVSSRVDKLSYFTSDPHDRGSFIAKRSA